MVTNTSNGKIKKTSRGMRKHVRRMKQETREAGIPMSQWKTKVRKPSQPKAKEEV